MGAGFGGSRPHRKLAETFLPAMLNPPINHMHAHHATLENANNRQVRGAVHAVCCICWAHRIPYAFRILHRSPTLILDTLKQDARKYFIHAHGVSGRRMFVFFVVGDGAALAEWCYWRLQPKAVIESYMDVAALAADVAATRRSRSCCSRETKKKKMWL